MEENNGKPTPVDAIDVEKSANIIERRRIIKQLPDVFNTDLLRKFFAGTADNLFQPEISEKISGFIGRTPTHTDLTTDFYINEQSKERQEHQLEPSMISVDPDTTEITNVMVYDDLLDLIRFQGGLTYNQDRLFKSEIYSWLPPINPDKIMNFTNYFWFPSGPDINIFLEITDIGNKIGTADPVTIQGVELEDGMRVLFKEDISTLYNDRVFVISGVGVAFALETDSELDQAGWDDVISGWDDNPWDGTDFEVIISADNPDYIVMERGASDNNAWSKGNRWYHRDELTQSQLTIALTRQATRPIIEFQKDMELYNHGTHGRGAATVRDDVTTDPAVQILGQQSYTIDGIDMRDGDTVLFTNTPSLQGLWDEQGWDFEDPSEFNVTALSAPHPQLGQDGFEWATGTFDPFYNVSYSAPIGDISLTEVTGSAVAITLAENFFTLGFSTGMRISMSGTTANDGIYTIQDIDLSGKIMTFVEPLVDVGELGTGNVTFIQLTTVFQNRVFEINGVGVGGGITLTLVADGQSEDGSPIDGDQINILLGVTHQGITYYWSDSEDFWVESQSKLTTNQYPLFQLYDTNAIKLQDPGEYPLSNFVGGKVFGYQLNDDPRQPLDDVLNIPLTFNDFSEIIFENHLVTDRYSFNTPQEEEVGYYYYNIRNIDDVMNNYNNGWNVRIEESNQRIIENFSNITTNIVTLSTEPTDLNLIDVYINGIQQFDNWTVGGKNIIFDNALIKSDIIKIYYYSNNNIEDVTYEIPINLTANPDNIEVDYIANSDYFAHFTSVINNQVGLIGTPNGANNWRDTTQDRSVGEWILQHRTPLLKTLALGSDRAIDFMLSVRYVEREYIRFRNKFLRKITEYNNDGIHSDTQAPSEWVEDALDSINLGKINDFPFSLSGMGIRANDESTYHPSSPSRLGIYQVYKPGIYLDSTYSPAKNVLQMHDGSIVIAYNDFRDDVILDFENNIYNTIPDDYKTENLPDFDWTIYNTTNHNVGEYSVVEFNKLLTPIIQRWAVFNDINLSENSIYSPTDPFTWNYSKQGVPGYWRGIYKFCYDTDRPNTHPWEMFGFSQTPEWWNDRYGVAPYTSSNTFLWNDMKAGRIAGGSRAGIYAKYERPDVTIPVNGSGMLLDPVALGIVSQPGVNDARADWEIGDHGPAESVFRRSEGWSFAIAQISYLMKPSRFIELGWNSNVYSYAHGTQTNKQWISDETRDRLRLSELYVHGETLDSGEVVLSDGIQQWITNYVTFNGQSITGKFGDVIRNIDVRLAHKMGGFINTNSTRVVADNFGVVPQEDVTTLLYNSPSIREELYSGVIIERVGTGWTVNGYDALNPVFTMNIPIKSSRQIAIEVGTIRVLKSSDYKDTVNTIPYGTIFNSRQSLYDFLIGYGIYLESKGWIFDGFDYDQNEQNDWSLSGKQFLFWSQGNWDDGSLMVVSPLAERVKFKSDHGIVANMEQIINGVYSLLDRDGRVIQPEDTFISRDDDNTILVVPINGRYIFSARLFVTEYEHIITFSNSTIFNDLIYNPLLNLRQYRLKVFTTRAGGWDGKYDAPGYIITGNTLTPNFEKSVNDIRKYFSIENSVDRTVLESSARRLIGFQERDYLTGLGMSGDTQFQFYQGFIREKGTRLVIDKLFRNSDDDSGDITIFEEWALRLGEYGAVQDFAQIGFSLFEEEWRAEPQMINFIDFTTAENPDSKFDDIIEMTTDDDRWITRPPFDGLARFPYRTPTAEIRSKNSSYLFRTDVSVGGYVLDDEVTYHVNTIEERDEIFDTQKITLTAIDLAFGDLIWVDDISNYYDINDPNDINDDDPMVRYNNSFMVYRYTDTGLTFSLPVLPSDNGGTLVLSSADHGFITSQIVMIDSDEGTSPDINGSYVITVPTEVTGTTFTSLGELIEGMYITINGQRIDIICDTVDEIIALINDALVPHVSAYNSGDAITLVDIETADIVLTVGSDASVIGDVGATYTNGHIISISGTPVTLSTGTATALGTANATYTNSQTIDIDATIITLSTGTDVDSAIIDINLASVSGITAYKRSGGLVIEGESAFILAEGGGTALADLGLSVLTYDLVSTIDDAVTDITAALITDIVAVNEGAALRISNTTTSLVVADDGGDTAFADLGIVAGTYENVLNEIGLTAGTFVALSSDSFVIQNTISNDTNIGVHHGTLGVFTESRFVDIAARDAATINAVLGSITFVADDYVYVDTRTTISEIVPLWEVYVYNGASWDIAEYDNVERTQSSRIDVDLFSQSILYNNIEDITDARMSVFDPAKGLFPSQVTGDLSYRIEYDPAKYTDGDETVFQIDPTMSWNDSYVGKAWWDVSAVEYTIYDQGSNRQRRNNWGTIINGKSIDVYDWVKSPVPPLEWANYVEENADQPEESFEYKPSGDAFMADVSENPPYTKKTITDRTTKLDVTSYYFWVKNSETVPNVKTRNQSVAQIARSMTNPTLAGIPWFAPISNDAIIISGIEHLLTNTDSVYQLNYNITHTDINHHREWALSRDGDDSDVPTDRFWNKMRDSLVGYDVNNDIVPDPNLEQSRKYGNFIRPRQTWFVHREEAIRILFNAINIELLHQCIVDDRPTMFDNLNNTSVEPVLYVSGTKAVNMYDYHVGDNTERDTLATSAIISIGEQVWVDGITETLSFWKVYVYDGIDITTQKPIYTEIHSEAYKVADLWNIIDYFEIGFDEDTEASLTVDTIPEMNALIDPFDDMIVRVRDSNSDGTNVWAIYQYQPVDAFNPWALKAKEGCTIEFLIDVITDSTYGNVDTLTDQSGRDQALRVIIDALRNDILTNLEQNQMFYVMIRYVFSEQHLVDWVFKTSYILAVGLNQAANQNPVLTTDTTDNIIEFINEAKPYHTKLRDFTTKENFGIDDYITHVTDFDKPVYTDPDTNITRVLSLDIPADVAILSDSSSLQNDWFNNYIADSDNIRQGNVQILFDRVSCDASGGWDNLFGWDSGVNENWDLSTFALNETAADRIIRLYAPQPFSITDVDPATINPANDVSESKDIASLISGCGFKGTIVDGAGMVIDIDDIDNFLDGGAMLNPGAPINPDDIIVDGNLFIQPSSESNHPEELVLSIIGESISICVNSLEMFEVIGTDIHGGTYNNGETIDINGVIITLSSGVFPADAVIDITDAVINAAEGSAIKPISVSFDGTNMKILSSVDSIILVEGSGTALVDLGFTANVASQSVSGAPNTAFKHWLNSTKARESQSISPFFLTTLDAIFTDTDTDIFVTKTTGLQSTGALIVGSFVDGIPAYEFITYTSVVDNTISGLTRPNPITHNSGIVLVLNVDEFTVADWEFYRINDAATTTLAADFNLGDIEMEITSVVGLPKQKVDEDLMKIPGVIWIGGERIEYHRRDGTTLRYIRRGTGGTSAGLDSIYDSGGDLISNYLDVNVGDVIYPSGTRIIDGTQKQAIPGGYSWEASPAGLQSLDSTLSTFLKNGSGSC